MGLLKSNGKLYVVSRKINVPDYADWVKLVKFFGLLSAKSMLILSSKQKEAPNSKEITATL